MRLSVAHTRCREISVQWEEDGVHVKLSTNFGLVCFFNYFHPISYFHLFIHPLPGLDHHNIGRPLRMAGLKLCDVIVCQANLWRLCNVVNNRFTYRKDGYSLCSVDGVFQSETFIGRRDFAHFEE